MTVLSLEDRARIGEEALTLMDYSFFLAVGPGFDPDEEDIRTERDFDVYLIHLRSMALAWLSNDARAFHRLWRLQSHFDVDIPSGLSQAELDIWAAEQAGLFTYDAWRAWVDSWLSD